MTVLASEILGKVGTILNDSAATRWTTTELLGWLNDGQFDIASKVPDSNSSTTAFQLIGGVKQQAPSDVIRVVEFVKNMGIAGTVPGLPIRVIDRKVMDAFYPQWTTDTANAVVQHSMYTADDDNRTFYVWPPQPVTGIGYIEIIYAQVPQIVTSAGNAITISDFYKNPLIDFCCYRGFLKDSQDANQLARSQAHYQAYANAIGIKYQFDTNSTNDNKA